MSTIDQYVTRSPRGAVRTVDVAGTDWPLYKLESLAVALIVFVALALTVTMQTAVLASAALGVALWWALKTVELTGHRRL